MKAGAKVRRGVLWLLVLALGWPVPAFGCETFRLLNLEDSLRESDAVVVGTVLDRGPARKVEDFGAGPEGGDPSWVTIRITQVVKGRVEEGQTIKLNTSEPCGYGLNDPGLGTFLFFLKREKFGRQYRRVWANSQDTLSRGDAGPLPLAVLNGRFRFSEETEWRTVERDMSLEELARMIKDAKDVTK